MYDAVQAKAEYPLVKGQLYVLTGNVADVLREMPDFWRSPLFQRFLAISWLVTLPTTGYLVYAALMTLACKGYGRPVRIAALCASLSPLSLHVIGLDYNRWTTLATTTSFLAFTITKLCFPPRAEWPQPAPRTSLLYPAALVALNLGSTIPLFDGYVVQNFPYEEHIADVIAIVQGRAPFPPRPEQCIDAYCATVVETLQPPRSAVSREQMRH